MDIDSVYRGLKKAVLWGIVLFLFVLHIWLIKWGLFKFIIGFTYGGLLCSCVILWALKTKYPAVEIGINFVVEKLQETDKK